MRLHRELVDDPEQYAVNIHLDEEGDLDHKKQVRRLLEDRLERQRLKKELDLDAEFGSDFDWSDLDR